MQKFIKSKWVDYEFDKEQTKARSMWTRAHKYQMGLSEALLTSPEKQSGGLYP